MSYLYHLVPFESFQCLRTNKIQKGLTYILSNYNFNCEIMKEYISELKSYDFYNEFKPGYYLDAYDEHKWKVGQIKQITKYGLRTTIEVHFDGYNSRYDQRYDLPSSHKLAPFRTNTLSYTGPFEPRRDDQLQKCSTFSKEFSKIVNNSKNLDVIKPTYVNQFIRGDLFIASDYVITKRYFETNFVEANNFLISYIKDGSKLMNICGQYLKELEKDNFDASLFNVHPKIALVLSLTQYLFILNTIIGNKDQRCTIETNYQKWIKNQVTFAKKVKQWVNQFNILNVCDKIMEFKAINGRGLPWSLKKQACLLLSYIREGYVFPTPTDHRQVIEIFDYMNYFCNKGLLKRDEEEKTTLSLIISLIISGNFEGRLRGLNELKKILDYTLKRKDLIILKLQQTDLLNFLIDNKNFNPEIFKRSLPLFSFCFTSKLMTKKDLTQILSLHKDKHELQLKGFYSALADFPNFLDADTIISFFKQIITLPLNELSVTLIKEYTMTALSKNGTFKQAYCKQGWQLGLTFYWSLITSQKVEITSDLKYKIIQAFASLLGDIYYSKQVEKFISLALKGIANRKNLQFYFKIIHQTLKLSKSTRIARNIEFIQKEVNIVDCVIDGLRNTQTLASKIWQCMFEFLQEVTFVSRKKLSFNQIKQFWNIRQCRPFLFKLLRKFRIKGEEDKSQQKIINKQLPLDTMKELISKIFLDFKEMEDYETISVQLYQTVDQLLIAFNHNTKSIDYNYKHTIRVKTLESIFGIEFYINVINNCKQQDIVEKSIHRFVEFFMRVKDSYRNIESIKLSNWNSTLQKLSKLKKNALLSYKIFLEDLNGRMKSLNILEPDLVQLYVLNKTTSVKKFMAVPRFTSLWKFRHLIGQQFNLPNLNFEMQLGSQFNETSFEKQEDFSMALITISKESHSVIITQTKNRHPHLQTIDAFYKSFAELRGDELYEWLNRQSESKQAIQILNKLPFIKRIQQKIIKLNFKDMTEIFDYNSMFRLDYQLKIIINEKNPKYIVGLIEKGFIPYISKIFINKDCFRLPQYYPILTNLMGVFNDLIKFSKMVKNPQLFSQNFLTELLHINKLKCSEYNDYIAKCLVFLKDFSCNRQLLTLFNIKAGLVFESKQFQKVFQCIALNKSKEKLSENIVEFAKQTNNQQNLLQMACRLMKSDYLIDKQVSCGILFDIISLLIQKKIPNPILQNLKSLSRLIRSKEIMQENQQTSNQLLIGYLILVLKIVKSKSTIETLEDILGDKIDRFFNFIINECLFNLEEPTKIRFKSPTLRSLGYQLISQFQYNIIGNKLSETIQKALRMGGSWRRQQEWFIAPTKQTTHKYTGLKNLAATCYINSLLQQLFFIQSFRDQIIGIDAQTIDDKENIVLELQNIFAHLKYSESPIYTTSSLCKKFILDGQPIDPRVQTDVDQFFHSLMDKLERNLSKINKKDAINNLFGGELSNLIIGSACEHASQRIEPFLSIRLEIKEKKSLEQALKDFIKGEVLQGDNAYFCEKCDAKVKAVKRVCLKTLPEILIVTLKRFEFDYQTMQKFKLNTYCSFPNVVNVFPFTRDGIDNQYDADKSLYQYRLKGVVIHYGISEAGHYTSYIQTQPQKWQYFDDEKITQFNSQELGAQCFGGIEENPFGDDQQKKKNAYLLFYEKIKKNSPKKILDLTQAPIMKEIKQENTRIKLVNLLFEPNIQNYIFKLGQAKADPKVFLMYFHLVFLRSAKRRQKLQNFYNCAQMLLKTSKQLSTWYLNQISQSFLYEFLFYSQPQIKMIITSLIIEAFKQNDNFESGILVLQQICAFIGKKNLNPAYKIIVNAIKMKKKQYEKYLKQIGLSEMVLLTIKNHLIKEPKPIPKQSQLKIRRSDNYFGYAACSYTDKGTIDQIDLFQCIDTLKVNLNVEDLQSIVKRAKKPKTQESIASIIAKRYNQLEHFARIQVLISENLSTLQFSTQEEHIFTFYIHLTEQYALIKDAITPKRIQKLAITYLKVIGSSLSGYKAVLLLIQGLFKICSGNLAFRDKISEQFQQKEGKSLLKLIKTWIKDVSANLNNLVRSNKMGYWRKPQQKGIPYRLLNYYLENDDKINSEKMLAALNAVVQKHNTYFSSMSNELTSDEAIKYQGEKYRFLRSYGLLAEIQSNDRARIVAYEDLTKLDYFC